ncbi:MAG TPA: TadE family type IV pilus minor pilin [Actinocrinis sp.]|nr:TadE family type IV pilus minor pilin [Actinocrinis sp.]
MRTRTFRKLGQPTRRLPGRPHHRLGPIATDARPAPNDGGYITAETALALPSLVLVFCSLLLVVLAAGVQLRCGDAAWEAARLAARGEPIDLVEDQVKPWTPTGSDVSVKQDQDGIQAIVSVRLGLPGARLPAIRVSSTAFVACESGLPCAAGDP